MTTDREEPTKDEFGNFKPEQPKPFDREVVERYLEQTKDLSDAAPSVPRTRGDVRTGLGRPRGIPAGVTNSRVIFTNAEGAALDNLMRDIGWTNWRKTDDDSTD